MNLALYGSGEFTEEVKDIDEYLITKYKPHNIAILPTAAGKENDYTKWLSMAKIHYAQYNLSIIEVPILNKIQANNQELINPILNADWIFFSGGDPNYLLNVLKNSVLWKEITRLYHEGVLLSGSSAGAMVMGNFILSNPFKAIFKNSDILWKEAFKLVDYTIFPHFNRIKNHPTFIKRVIKQSPKNISSSWIGIDENTALIIDDNKQSIHGPGNVEIHTVKNQ